jgi:DNA-directed RNA polymerase subunit L
MDVKILKEEKNEMDLEMNSLTLAELLRNYLNKEGAEVAAWRRDHLRKSPILHIRGDNPKKLIKKAITAIEKELERISSEFKKLK